MFNLRGRMEIGTGFFWGKSTQSWGADFGGGICECEGRRKRLRLKWTVRQGRLWTLIARLLEVSACSGCSGLQSGSSLDLLACWLGHGRYN